MTMVDEQGRLFGRVNLVDAVLVLLVLGLVPLGYGAYALFKAPAPRIAAVEPSSLEYGPNLRVRIRGEHLRPYMRVSFDHHQGLTFLFGSSTTAEVDLGDIPPGVYDVVLYDHAQERARLAQALTIKPPPLPTTYVDVVGVIRTVTPGVARLIVPDMPIPPLGVVLRVGEPTPSLTRVSAGEGTVEIPVESLVDVPVTIRAGCHLQAREGQAKCVGAGVPLEPDAFIVLPSQVGELAIQIDQVRAPLPLVDVVARVRFVGDPERLALLKGGDLDVGVTANALAAGARVTAAGAIERVPASVVVLSDSRVVAAGALATREATLRLPAQQGVGGWRYAGVPLRVGSAFVFRTRAYELHGSIVRLTPAGPDGGGGEP